jgi:hypothetical protein
VGVGRTSVSPSALHTLFSSVTWWRAHNLLELGTHSYTEVACGGDGHESYNDHVYDLV